MNTWKSDKNKTSLSINFQPMNIIRKYSIVLVTLLLAILFLKFQGNLSDRFDETRNGYKEKNAMNFSPNAKPEDMKEFFLNQNYLTDSVEADYVAGQIARKFKAGKTLPNLYSLNTSEWKLDFDSVSKTDMKLRVERAEKVMKWDIIDSLKNGKTAFRGDGKGNGSISVRITEKDSGANFLKVLFNVDYKSVKDVDVVLFEHFYNIDGNADDSVLAVQRTDSEGCTVFENLDTSRFYSVQPVKKGCDYGSAKGTVGKPLSHYKKGKIKAEFTQKPYKLPLLDASTVKKMRDEKTASVRTPDEFKSQLTKDFIVLVLAWWALFVFLTCRSRKRGANFDFGMVSILMLLTGICQLMMYSINDPLIDKLLGREMTQGTVIGVAAMALLSCVDFVKFYQNQSKLPFDIPLEMIKWFFKPFRRKVSYLAETLKGNGNVLVKILATLALVACLPLWILDLLQLPRICDRLGAWLDNLPKGIGYLLMALLLTAMLWTPFGSEVGGMKVNLNLLGLKFQPSEIAKYFIIIFMAAFFCKQGDKIVGYSNAGSVQLLASKLKTLFWIFVGMMLLMVMYLLLGDMGPGLVLGLTFILLYSLIKSKVQWNDDNVDKYRKILTCDFAMLIYGIVSFVAFLLIGWKLGNMGIFCVLWFLVWIVGFWMAKKRFYESAVFMNLVIAMFIFGGSLLGLVSKSAGERFDQRIEMCTNTWGDLGRYENDVEETGYLVSDDELKPSVNSQVAEGLWGLASGGFTGQGLGDGNPQIIPAFHTDMVLESIGEQIGWIGLLLIVALFALLLRKTLVVGYRTSHTFAFYLCMGIAVVTGVQFMIIALGSTGMIPLTGIVVPFLSYGRTSMIINLMAFGIVLSISKNRTTDTQNVQSQFLLRQNMMTYSYPISIVSWIYLLLAAVILSIFLNYQKINQNKTLIRPLFVLTQTGEPVIEYNPRISLLMNKMPSGNIFDRNGLLLATSDRNLLSMDDSIKNPCPAAGDSNREYRMMQAKRYYPFGDDMFFTVGDFNTRLYFSYSENNPMGYMAEAQHLAYLRGFDNVKYYKDENGNKTGKPVVVEEFGSDKFFGDRFLGETTITKSGTIIRDYSPLLPFLKAGINSRKVKDFCNGEEVDGIRKKDLWLTVDARLQKDMQNKLTEYARQNFPGKNWNKLRISVAVLDARNGDLLASANYPKPSQDTLWKYRDVKSYSDALKGSAWKAYSDRDLALTYQTAPGSTAKVMSALAGLQKHGASASQKTYPVYDEECIERSGGVGTEPKGDAVNMRDAIVVSSNCYFINLVNDLDLYDNLDSIYRTVGIRLDYSTPYYLNHRTVTDDRLDRWKEIIEENRSKAISRYKSYIANRFPKPSPNNPNPKPNFKAMTYGPWQWAWGQGTLSATPLNMARVAATVANGGSMPVTRYILKAEDSTLARSPKSIRIVSGDDNEILKGYMRGQASISGHGRFASLGSRIGGKTGTPERIEVKDTILVKDRKTGGFRKKNITVKPNDGWYIFFIEDCTIKSMDETHKAPLAVAVRMERLRVGNSGQAMSLSKYLIENVLGTYIN